MHLSDNAIRVLEARYLRRDANRRIIESPEEMFRRVASSIASAEERFGGASERKEWEEEFFSALASLDFLPNSPTLMNAGTPLSQLSACFVLPMHDSMEEIFDSLKLMALVQQTGGGTGFSFSRLRPKGDLVASSGGAASGPVSFMRIFDAATENIRQGGKRRGANMAVLRVDHPDIEEFVQAKLDERSLQNFNLSVAVTDAFMEAVEADFPFGLRHPTTGETVRKISAQELLTRIAEAAWKTGDPGLVFLDAVNRGNPTPDLGPIEATNPCGEVPLLPYEACNLGSINLSHMLCRDGETCTVDWNRLEHTTGLAVRFLDDVIEVGKWPASQIAAITRANRKVGLGVMGLAEMLILLGIPYASDEASSLADDLMRFISEKALATSEELSHQRGVFSNWNSSVYAARNIRVRNATRTSIAPTGTLSIIAGTSASIEPLFALAYYREHVLEGQRLPELNPLFLRYAQQQGFYSERVIQQLRKGRSLSDLTDVPEKAKRLFQTALNVAPEQHLRIQAGFQNHVDNAVSKTVNLPREATVDEVISVYRQAWQLGLKGVTIFRYGSKKEQVLRLGAGESPDHREHFAKCDPHACRL